MSMISDARSYADLALSQAKSAINQGKTALSQGRAAATGAVSAANRLIASAIESAVESISVSDLAAPAYVWIGAADLVTQAVAGHVETLPLDAAGTASKLREVGRSRASKAQADALTSVIDLRERFEASVDNARALGTARRQAQARAAAKQAAAAYIAAARELYGTLSARGEARVAEVLELTADSRLVKLVSEVGSAGSRAPSPVKAPAAKAPSASGPAKKAPAKKAPAKKAPAKKAPAKKAPAKKAPAKQTVAKAPAKKSAR
jgi:hypothetical protein